MAKKEKEAKNGLFPVFGEFDSWQEINEAAEGLLQEGDQDGLRTLAEENGLEEEVESYLAGDVTELCDPISAALGKIKKRVSEPCRIVIERGKPAVWYEIRDDQTKFASSEKYKKNPWEAWTDAAIPHLAYSRIYKKTLWRELDKAFPHHMFREYLKRNKARACYGNGDIHYNYFDAYSIFPLMESLEKTGKTHLVDHLAGGRRRNFAQFDKKAATVSKMVGISKKQYREFKNPTKEDIERIQFLNQEGVSFTAEQYEMFKKYTTWYAWKETVREVLRHTTLHQYLKYAVSVSKADLHNWYADYLRMAGRAGYDLNNRSVLFPKNIREAHDVAQDLLEKERLEKDLKAADQRYKGIPRIEKKIRKQFTYSNGKYCIRPAKTNREIVREGQRLHICVGNGRYAESMEKEKTYILFLRKKEDPDTPFYTVEITPEFKIIQRHGKYNKENEEVTEVDSFLKKFVEEKGNGKSIMQQDDSFCYLCGANGTMDYLHWHHVFGGANRKWSEKYGLKVRLCGQQCHENGPNAVHRNKETRDRLREEAQRAFEKNTEPDKTFSGSLEKTICKHQAFNITEAIITRQASRLCREAEGGPMEQLSIRINSMEDAVRGIEAAQRKACTAFIEIGYILRKADDAELYKEKGCSSIFVFAEKEYGWDQSQTSRFMSINREYSEGGYSCTLQERYEGYGQAKLAEMLKLPEGLREEITPEMKRDDIRELKKDYRAAEETRQEEQFREAFAPAQTEGALLEKTARALLSQTTYAQRILDLWPLMLKHRQGETVNEMDVLMALIPGGYGHARVQSCMCFFRKEEMSIMHGRDKERHSYTELLDTIANLSETAEFDTPENWYQTVFGKEFPGKLREEEKTPENDENPKGNQASGKAENQAEKPAKTIPEKEQNHTLHTGGTQEKEESGENPSTVAPEKGENNENPKGNQPLEGLADTTEGKCPYCCGSKEIYSINYAFFISLSLSGEGKIGKITAPQEHDTIQFEYCPKCGRELWE